MSSLPKNLAVQPESRQMGEELEAGTVVPVETYNIMDAIQLAFDYAKKGYELDMSVFGAPRQMMHQITFHVIVPEPVDSITDSDVVHVPKGRGRPLKLKEAVVAGPDVV